MKIYKKSIRNLFIFIVLTMAIFILSSCNLIKKFSPKRQIVTTLFPQYQFVKALISDDKQLNAMYDVSLIIPPGVDSHTFDPSVTDLLTIKNADLFIYTSDTLETWVKALNLQKYTELLDLSSDERIIQLKVEEEHDEHEEHEEHHHDHEFDPHYFVYPIYAQYMVEEIRDKLCEITPDEYNNRQKIIDNATAYISELKKIDEDIKSVVSLAKDKTIYFASPFSFFYWTHFYGLEYELTYATCSTEVEPSTNTIINFINKINDNNVKAIFIKELLNTNAANMIASKTNVEILLLHSCHNVSKDDFNNQNVTYLSLMHQNVINLAKGLNVDISLIDNFNSGEEETV